MDHGQRVAIDAYATSTGRIFVPGEVVELPIDALAFATYQNVWLDLESYIAERCMYDDETNKWLLVLVTSVLDRSYIPPIYVDVLDDGFAIVDGAHRVTSAFILGRPTIRAHLNQQ